VSLSKVAGRLKHIALRQARGAINRLPMKNCAPKVSVIIPAYNVEEYLDETMRCVTNQTLLSFEAIIIDDGSTDSTKAIAKHHARRDFRFKVISQENAGASVARNKGVKIARGKYIYYLDGDDLITRNAFNALYKSCESNDADMAIHPYVKSKTKFKGAMSPTIAEIFSFPKDGVTVHTNSNILASGNIGGKFVSKKFLLDINLTFIEGMLAEDQPYTAELYCRAKKINIVKLPTYWWRDRLTADSAALNRPVVKELKLLMSAMLRALSIIKKYGNGELCAKRISYYLTLTLARQIRLSSSSDYDYYHEMQKIYSKLVEFWHENTEEELPSLLAILGQIYETGNQELLRKFCTTIWFNDKWLFVDNVDGKPLINIEKTCFEPDKTSLGKTLYSIIDKTRTYPLYEAQARPVVSLYSAKRNGDKVVHEGYAYLMCIDPAKFKYNISVTATPPNREDLKIPVKFEQIESLEAVRASSERTFDATPAGFRVTSDIKMFEEFGTWFYLDFTISAAGFTKRYREKVWIVKFSDFEPKRKAKISDIKIAKVELMEDALKVHLERETPVSADASITVNLKHKTLPIPEALEAKLKAGEKELIITLPLYASHPGYHEMPIAARARYGISCIEMINGVEHRIIAKQDYVDKLPEWKYYNKSNMKMLVSARPKNLTLDVRAPYTKDDMGAYNIVKNRRIYLQSKQKPNPKAVLFSSEGNKVNDSPLAIHNEMLERVNSDKYAYTWVIGDYSRILPKNAKGVISESKDYYDAINDAGMFFTTFTQPTFFQKHEGQRIVSLGHGYPFKDMGVDFHRSKPPDAPRIDLFIKRFKQWDYFLSPAPYATKLLKEKFEFEGEMLEVGYPRNDIFFDAIKVKETRNRIRKAYGIAEGKKVILYAPTFRDYMRLSLASAMAHYVLDVEKLAIDLGDEYAILRRGHPVFAAQQNEKLEDKNAATIFDVSLHPDINDLIIASDMMIGDYSSVRFDYSLTRKPIMNYVPDFEQYSGSREFLMPYEESVVGPIVTSYDDLFNFILTADKWSNTPEYKKEQDNFYNKYTPLEDGFAAKRAVDLLFPDIGERR
jgi:CDP-glycerol glycerophosphotransferase